jgi:hypothetical protein
MLSARLRHKVPREFEGMEDVLTSSVFALLRTLPRCLASYLLTKWADVPPPAGPAPGRLLAVPPDPGRMSREFSFCSGSDMVRRRPADLTPGRRSYRSFLVSVVVLPRKETHRRANRSHGNRS